MNNSAHCTDCGQELDLTNEQPNSERSPCPQCGSKKRVFTLRAEGGVFSVGTASLQFTASAIGDIAVQAVVTLGDKTEEGRLIEAVAPAWYEIAKLIESDRNFMHKIDPRKWEEMIAGWYELHGFTVTLTPRSADFGRDVIAEKPGVLSIRIIDQVKAYAPGHKVPANDVRALLGVLQADQRANKGLVTTTSDFAPGIATDPFIKPFLPTRLELVNGDELTRRLAELAAKKK